MRMAMLPYRLTGRTYQPLLSSHRVSVSCSSGRDSMALMHQAWDKLLFLHWSIEAPLLRAIVPERLEIDLFDGRAWVGVAPFTMWGIRPLFLPAIPGLSDSHELNVRTYVTLDGVPGVWFFSLDAANPLMVWGARVGFYLPYYHARMHLRERDGAITFSSRREREQDAPANFDATWVLGEHLPQSRPGSLDHFLTERYCLFAADGERILRADIEHKPWPLCRATVKHLSSTMLESHGLRTPADAPLLHALREPLHVKIQAPRRA